MRIECGFSRKKPFQSGLPYVREYVVMDIIAVLKETLRVGASDLHLVADRPVAVRVNGEIIPMTGSPVFSTQECAALLSRFLSDTQRAHFERSWSVDSSFALEGVRFRINVAVQRQGLEMVFRVIPNTIPSPEEIGL